MARRRSRAGLPALNAYSVYESWRGQAWDTTEVYITRYNPADSISRTYVFTRSDTGTLPLDTSQHHIAKLGPDGRYHFIDTYLSDRASRNLRLFKRVRNWMRFQDEVLESEAWYETLNPAADDFTPFHRYHYLYDSTFAPTAPIGGTPVWTLWPNPSPASGREGLVIATAKAIDEAVTVRLLSAQGQLLGQAALKPADGRRIVLAQAGIASPQTPGLFLVQVQTAQAMQVLRCVIE